MDRAVVEGKELFLTVKAELGSNNRQSIPLFDRLLGQVMTLPF